MKDSHPPHDSDTVALLTSTRAGRALIEATLFQLSASCTVVSRNGEDIYRDFIGTQASLVRANLLRNCASPEAANEARKLVVFTL